MDCVLLRLFFDCRLDIDDNDLPLPGIVLVVSPVGSDDSVKQHLIAKSTKVDVVLGLQTWTMRRLRCRYIAPVSPSFFSHRLFGARRRNKRSQRQRCWTSSNAFGSPACYPVYLLSRWRSCARRPCRIRTVDSGTPSRPTSSSLHTLGPDLTLPMPLQRYHKYAKRWRPCRTAISYWLITSRPTTSSHPSARSDGMSRHPEHWHDEKRNTPYRVTFTSAADVPSGRPGMRVFPTFQ
jgi:hypothetical protein